MKIFLSSTSVDLGSTRAEVSKWLSGVFGADLIIMETFGSDTAPPDIVSVRRVREADVFVGIYANRFGTVDERTGESITELELDEARHAQSTGVIADILLYVLAPDAQWPSEFRETGPSATAGLQRLRAKAQDHSCTLFTRSADLPFFITRDVYRLLAGRRGQVGMRQVAIPDARALGRPVGMEFLTSADRRYLAGRGEAVRELRSLIQKNGIVLLLGDSGVGKTSLIQAGLIPDLNPSPRVIYTRPLGLPASDVVSQVQASIFTGRPDYRGPLMPLLAEISAAIGEDSVLLVIDQFEDVLGARDLREVDRLVADLAEVHELSLPHLRLLISYRADFEGRLGQLCAPVQN